MTEKEEGDHGSCVFGEMTLVRDGYCMTYQAAIPEELLHCYVDRL
jgi:hypothetical protein